MEYSGNWYGFWEREGYKSYRIEPDWGLNINYSMTELHRIEIGNL